MLALPFIPARLAAHHRWNMLHGNPVIIKLFSAIGAIPNLHGHRLTHRLRFSPYHGSLTHNGSLMHCGSLWRNWCSQQFWLRSPSVGSLICIGSLRRLARPHRFTRVERLARRGLVLSCFVAALAFCGALSFIGSLRMNGTLLRWGSLGILRYSLLPRLRSPPYGPLKYNGCARRQWFPRVSRLRSSVALTGALPRTPPFTALGQRLGQKQNGPTPESRPAL
jgi:hypothetical protein